MRRRVRVHAWLSSRVYIPFNLPVSSLFFFLFVMPLPRLFLVEIEHDGSDESKFAGFVSCLYINIQSKRPHKIAGNNAHTYNERLQQQLWNLKTSHLVVR